MSTQAKTASGRADAWLGALDDTGRAVARRVVLRLVSFGEDGPDTSRQQPVSALHATGDPERLAEILRNLTEAGVLRIDGEAGSAVAVVALAPEALSTWPTLQAWLRAHGKHEQLRRQLETCAARWWQHASQGVPDDRPDDSPDGRLLDKAELVELAGWLTADTRRDLGVSEVSESFIAASRAAARRRWWPGRAYTGTFLAISLMLLILATPIILLLIVVLAASVIHALG